MAETLCVVCILRSHTHATHGGLLYLYNPVAQSSPSRAAAIEPAPSILFRVTLSRVTLSRVTLC